MTCRFCNRVRRVLRSVGIPIQQLPEVHVEPPTRCHSLRECMNTKAKARAGLDTECVDCRFPEYRVRY